MSNERAGWNEQIVLGNQVLAVVLLVAALSVTAMAWRRQRDGRGERRLWRIALFVDALCFYVADIVRIRTEPAWLEPYLGSRSDSGFVAFRVWVVALAAVVWFAGFVRDWWASRPGPAAHPAPPAPRRKE